MIESMPDFGRSGVIAGVHAIGHEHDYAEVGIDSVLDSIREIAGKTVDVVDTLKIYASRPRNSRSRRSNPSQPPVEH